MQQQELATSRLASCLPTPTVKKPRLADPPCDPEITQYDHKEMSMATGLAGLAEQQVGFLEKLLGGSGQRIAGVVDQQAVTQISDFCVQVHASWIKWASFRSLSF